MTTPTPAARPLILVSCGARKGPQPAPAADLYTGSYIVMCLRAARALADDADIRILSARHGLVELAQVIEPYDTRITDTGAITAEWLCYQAAAAGLLGRPVTVLAGAAYTRLVRRVWPHAHAPLEGLPGIGAHRRRLAEIITSAAR
ncbi:DUF6884 domain-containing protein [Nocardia veterana]|uniref:DUF6884 domain-containing protein n=1 Tax=Nocardia veterana TaxID=132249 RepID=A0A7X6M461_9NOCA|nr:DUF6884 domain-containing protein [Nocardia veterana]NKY89876.1 hypothetical protein [Nocardia veterana]